MAGVFLATTNCSFTCSVPEGVELPPGSDGSITAVVPPGSAVFATATNCKVSGVPLVTGITITSITGQGLTGTIVSVVPPGGNISGSSEYSTTNGMPFVREGDSCSVTVIVQPPGAPSTSTEVIQVTVSKAGQTFVSE